MTTERESLTAALREAGGYGTDAMPTPGEMADALLDCGVTVAGETPEETEALAGRLLVAAARERAARGAPADAHELRHLWAAINAGNSDVCDGGSACQLDSRALAEWSRNYPRAYAPPAVAANRSDPATEAPDEEH